MPYPTITYDAATGSDTDPTGKDASGTNGDITDGSMGADAVVDGTFDTGYGFEAVTNGSFATDTDWTKSAGVTISGGACRILTTGAYATVYQYTPEIFALQGKVVTISVQITAYVSGQMQVSFDGGTRYPLPMSVGTHVVTIVDNGTQAGPSATFRIERVTPGVTTDITFDNVSVREVVGAGPELVNNGTFGYGITGWTNESELTGSIAWDGVGSLELTTPIASTDEGKAYQILTVEVGKKYRVQVERSGGASIALCSSFSQFNNDYFQSPNSTAAVDEIITATTTTLYVSVRNFASVTTPALIDNVSVTEVLDSEWVQTLGTVGIVAGGVRSTQGFVQQTSAAYGATKTKVVEVTLDVTAYVSGTLRVRFTGDSSYVNIPSSVGTHSVAFVNNGNGTGTLEIGPQGAGDITWDNVSVREVTGFGAELVTNGTFTGTGVTTGWTLESTGTNDNGVNVFSGTTGGGTNLLLTHSTLAAVTGKTYKITHDRVSGVSFFKFGGVLTAIGATAGTTTSIVKAVNTGGLNLFAGSHTTTASIDNVSVTEVRSAPTLTFNETVDCTGVANDGGSDYVWIDTPTNGRRLFTVTSFLPSVAACTSIRTLESPTVDATGDWWAINGTRQTLDSNATIPDPRDWGPGWNIEFASGTYPTVQMFVGYTHTVTSGWVVGDAPITMGPTADATTRPVIELTTNSYLMLVPNHGKAKVRGLRLGYGSGTPGTNTYIYVQYSNSSLWLDDCVVVPHPTAATAMITGQANIYATNCHFTAAGTYGIDFTATNGGSRMRNCVIDGAGGTLASSAAILLSGNFAAVSVMHCLVTGSAGAGISIRNETGINLVEVAGCTIVDNAGDGITTSSTQITHRSAANLYNNIIAYNGGYGVTDTVTDSVITWNCDNNAVYANGNGAYNGRPVAGPRAITLTADPFTSRATGDYTLNNTLGGGALLRAASYPASMPDGD